MKANEFFFGDIIVPKRVRKSFIKIIISNIPIKISTNPILSGVGVLKNPYKNNISIKIHWL